MRATTTITRRDDQDVVVIELTDDCGLFASGEGRVVDGKANIELHWTRTPAKAPDLEQEISDLRTVHRNPAGR